MSFLPFISVKKSPTPVKARDREHLLELIGEEMERSGHECSLNHIDVSEVTSMCLVFEEHPTFNGDISQWDTSNVTNMSRMFRNSSFNGDLSKWNIGQVMDMTAMFQSSPFNGNISNWDVSRVTDMYRMFDNCSFNGDISGWNVSKVHNMGSLFSSSKFQGNISGWDVSNVRNMSWMFENSPFDGDLSRWDVSKVKNFGHMFSKSQFNGDISNWNVSQAENMKRMFFDCPFDGDLSLWKVPEDCDTTMFNRFHLSWWGIRAVLVGDGEIAKEHPLYKKFQEAYAVVTQLEATPEDALLFIGRQLLGGAPVDEVHDFCDFS